jgi:class 3 adenylate cyclase/tetratricopeptide (TPR) repeat protein
MMDFYAVLDQVLALLRQRGRVSYRALKRQFDLDDAYLDDLKMELIEVQQCARDQEGTMLVWTGQNASAAAPAPIPSQAPLAFTPPYLAEKILTSRSALEGERKQVTVLFADLKGSMELLADRDPEEARQLLDPVLERMMAAVHRYEGTVNQVLGDGIMALFGAPIAHEDHAVRACYAALAMQEAIRSYAEEVRRSHGIAVQIRVGLNSGEVVVRAIGNDLHMDYTAVGQTTHLAARMEQLAQPGSTLLTAETLRLVEGLVHVTALGPVPVKGLDAPIEVYELVGATAQRGRFQARMAGGLTRFVGRQHELAMLHQALHQAAGGHGQVAAMVGEAGVGKSRLIHEFVHSPQTQGWLVLESASVSYGKATPYFPVLDLLRRYCDVDDGDDPRTIRGKVTGQVVTLDPALQDTVPALLSLLEALPEDSPFLTLEPPQRRQRTLDALKRVLLRESQVQPVLLVFEDLHWIDSETQALLDSLVESLPTVRLLLLVNYRPEYQHGWGSKSYYTQLRLDPLPPVRADEFLQALLGDDASLKPLTQLLIARTEGNPFFLEESVRTLVETGVLVGEPSAYRLAHALPTVQVPVTVQAVLAARIDRLPPEEKRLLQTAAVIGSEVPLPLLQTIAESPEATLHHGLAHLQAAEFVYETRLFPEVLYTFKHALTHEVAYGSLLQERRRALHVRIVEALEALYPDRLTEQVDRLAHHAVRGQVWDKALRYLRQAGVKATERSANSEAVAYFEQALEALTHLPESRSTLEQSIDLRLDVRHPLNQLGETERILEHLREAERLAEALDDQLRLGRVAAYLTTYYYAVGNQERAVASGQRALTIATALGNFPLQVELNFRLGQVYNQIGQYRVAMSFLSRNVENVELLQGELAHRMIAPVSFSAFSRAYLVLCLAERGEFPAGTACGEEAVRIAEALDQPFSVAMAHYGLGLLYLRQGQLDRAMPLLQHSLSVCQSAQTMILFPWAAAALGAVHTLRGSVAEAVALLEEARGQATTRKILFGHTASVVHLSETYLRAGHMHEATEVARQAVHLARDYTERGNEAYALRLLGDIAAHREPLEVEEAEAYYRQALALAEELGMRPLQAHCHRGLGMLYAKTGQREEARTALSTAINLYRAMEMTFWLPEAETALAQVEEE